MYQDKVSSIIQILEQATSIIKTNTCSPLEVENKEDGSPVTNIDKKLDQFLREELTKLFPNHAFLTEESVDDLSRLDNDYAWIIDPIDGTEDFVKGQFEYTINVALAYKHEIVMGFIMVPSKEELYYAIKGEGSYFIFNGNKERIHVSNKIDNLIVLSSPFHESELEKEYFKHHQDKIKEIVKCGAAYKACLIARGLGDCTYRFSCHNKEWDTAAPDIIVSEAGGYLLNGDGTKMTYNRKDVVNHNGYLILNNLNNFFK